MNVWDYIEQKLEHGPIHMSLIDPEKGTEDELLELAYIAEKDGTDLICVGGSTGIYQPKLDNLVKGIKNNNELPVIFFPSSHEPLSKEADAMFFPFVPNAENTYFLRECQLKMTPFVRENNIETISLWMMIFEPGMTSGKMTSAELLPRDNVNKSTIAYAQVGELSGFKLIFLEAGSGASRPISPKIISHINEKVSTPIMVCGGIKNEKQVREFINSGADIISTGYILETEKTVRKIIDVIDSYRTSGEDVKFKR